MTLNNALIQSLQEIEVFPITLDSCFWVSHKNAEEVWIYMETKDGKITSHIVPLTVFQRQLAK